MDYQTLSIIWIIFAVFALIAIGIHFATSFVARMLKIDGIAIFRKRKEGKERLEDQMVLLAVVGIGFLIVALTSFAPASLVSKIGYVPGETQIEESPCDSHMYRKGNPIECISHSAYSAMTLGITFSYEKAWVKLSLLGVAVFLLYQAKRAYGRMRDSDKRMHN